MARERMVTRTVVVTNVEVMQVDITSAEVTIKERELSGVYADTATALKAVKKLYETETLKCVSIQTMTEKEVLYGMKEIDFIKLAKVLPPRGTKSADDADAEETAEADAEETAEADAEETAEAKPKKQQKRKEK